MSRETYATLYSQMTAPPRSKKPRQPDRLNAGLFRLADRRRSDQPGRFTGAGRAGPSRSS